MLIKNKSDLYITLSIIGIIFILSLELLSSPVKPKEGIFDKNILTEEFIVENTDNLIISSTALLFLLLFIFGIINLIIFIINKLNRKLTQEINEPPITISLNKDEASKLFFLVIYFYLAVYLITMGVSGIRNLNEEHRLISIIISNTLINIITAFLIFRFISLESLGVNFDKNHFIFTIKLYSAILVLIYIASSFLITWGKKINMPSPYHPAANILMALDNKWLMTVFVLEISILAPLSEELLFRGFIYKMLRKHSSWMLASIITSSCFAFLHRSLFGFFIIFIISMSICYLYEKTQNIVAAFFFHSLHNCLGILYIFAIKGLTTGG